MSTTNPDKITTYVAKKPTVRVLIALAAAKNLHVENFDITAALLHEKYEHSQTVYIRQYPRLD